MVDNSPITTKGNFTISPLNQLNQVAGNNNMISTPENVSTNLVDHKNQLNQITENTDMIVSQINQVIEITNNFISALENVNKIPIDQSNQEAENIKIIVLDHQETNHFNSTVGDLKENQEVNQEVENIDRVNYDPNDYNNLMSTSEHFSRNPVDELIQESKNNDFFVFDQKEPKNVNSTAENQ